MKNRKKSISAIFAVILMLSMLIGIIPLTAFAYYEEPFFDGDAVDVCTEGKTYSLFTEDNLEDQNGTTFLYVVKSGDRYYTLGNPRYTEFKEVDSVLAVDITEYYDADTNTFSGISNNVNVGAMQYQMKSGSYMYVDGDMLLALSVPFESEGETWFDGGIRYYSPDETYSYSRPLWHSNGDGSGYFYDSYIDWFGDSDTWVYGVLDLKFDGVNYIFALRDKSEEYNEARNADPDNYDIGVNVKAYLYAAPCGHEQNVHSDADAPNCMEKGCEEYWYCPLCDTYFKNSKMTEAYDGFPEISALGHDWDGGKCNNCNRPVPVYSKVTNKTDFFALADDTMYVLVAEYEGKYYTPDSSLLYSYVFDLDEDGYADIYNVDENNNGTPDVAEIDWDENGVYDLWEHQSEEERREYFDSICHGYLTDMLYGQTAGIPVKEIALNPDGTISHDAVKDALEFEMIKLHSGEDNLDYTLECVMQFVVPNTFINSPAFIPEDRPYNKLYPDEGDTYYWAVLFYNDRDSYYTYDWDLGDYVDGLPFLDICEEGSIALSKANSMFSSEFEEQLGCLRLRDYNGKLSFVVGADYALEGSEWVDDENGGYYDTNDTQACVYLYASAQYDSHTCEFGDWVDDEVTETHTRTCKDTTCDKSETLPHNWDDGVQSGTANCFRGVTTTYTCTDNCGATKSETAEGLGHDWNAWTDDGENSPTDTHSHTCKRGCGVVAETEAHAWGAWVKEDATSHKKTCSGCNGTRVAAHTFGEWTPVGDGTTERRDCTEESCDAYETRTPHVCAFGAWYDAEDGIKHRRDCTVADCNEYEEGDHSFGDFTKIDENFHAHTCSVCNAQEKIEHSFYDWIAKDNNDHVHECMECDYESVLPHDYEREVTKEPTETEVGEATYTCSLCSHSYTEEIAKLTHVCDFGDFVPDPDNDAKHIRKCDCGKSESAAHELQNEVVNWELCGIEGQGREWCEICGYENYVTRPALEHAWDDGVITTEPTLESTGIKTYTCTLCDATYTEELPKRIAQISGEVIGTVLNVSVGSNAYIPEGTVFDVVEKPTEEIPDEVLGEIAVTADGAAKPLGMYDLSLLLDGAKIQPDGTVEITLPAPDLAAEYDRIIVVYIAPDGSYEECKTTVNDDGTITFETDHFSRYAVIGITEDDGLGAGAIVGIVAGALVVLGGGGFAIFWFVIEKKSAAELLALVKNHTNIARTEADAKEDQ